MPSRNAIKKYLEGGIYHIYNRGINKEDIFRDEEDYKLFLNLFHEYLSERLWKSPLKSYYQKIELYAYCLMPNHMHLLLRQLEVRIISEFMKSLAVRFTRRTNCKYERVGDLFQGVFKARLIESDADFIATADYIHKNPSEIQKDIENYPFSSLKNYVKGVKEDYLITEKFLSYFGGSGITYFNRLKETTAAETFTLFSE